ncbi:MAG: DUF4125 family protein [Deltaproteobacteria bacterium]|nr:DUF4125 family protein [Deltaproteobacteria bacterium]
MRESLIRQIVEREWTMFSTVSNVGGPADCQSDPASFAIMRQSQIGVWPEKLLESLLADLTAASLAGRNLMTEKYAWMMETSFPDEFKAVADRLPTVDRETLALIGEIVAVNLEWKTELSALYPHLSGRGRAIRARDAGAWETSFETYLEGELKTYSPHSLRILHEHTLEQKKNGVNGAQEVLLGQVRQYGYSSLAEAEKACR